MNAIQQLQDALASASPRAALATLNRIVDRSQIAELFAHFFPQDYETSSFDLLQCTEEELSEADKQFFRLVDQHLFPCDEWWIEEMLLESEPGELAGMPLMEEGYVFVDDNDYMEEVNKFRFPCNLLMIFFHPPDSDPGDAWDTVVRGAASKLNGVALPAPEFLAHWDRWEWGNSYLDYDVIEAAFQDDPILKDIRLALDVLNQDSNNPWVDYNSYNESGEFISFDVESFEWWAESWKDATRLFDLTNQVIDEFEAHPERLVDFVNAVNAATIWERKKNQKKARKTNA